MLIKENHCVECKDVGLHCLGDFCRKKSVNTYICDSDGCGQPAQYRVYDIDLCPSCARDYLKDIFDDSTIPELIDFFDCTDLKPISEEYY